MRPLILALILALACPPPAAHAATPPRITVPITQTHLPDGDIRYTVPIQVGTSPPIPALLDTGSIGLRILRTQLQPESYADTHTTSTTTFSAGDRLSGTIGLAILSIGAATTPAPIPFALVDTATCMSTRPQCGAALAATSQPYGIGGDGIPGQGFQAILGIGIGPATDAQNPLLFMGSQSWLITLPEPSSPSPGTLIINPTPADEQNAQIFPLHPLYGGWQEALPGCLSNTSTGQQYCGPTLLDTGSPGMVAYIQGALPTRLWNQNEHVQLTFAANAANAASAPAITIPFTVGRTPGSFLLQAPPFGAQTSPQNQAQTSLQTSLLSGFLPFFYNQVGYNAASGHISLTPRADAPSPESSLTTTAEPPASDIEVIQMNAPSTLPGTTPGTIPGLLPGTLPVVITPSP